MAPCPYPHRHDDREILENIRGRLASRLTREGVTDDPECHLRLSVTAKDVANARERLGMSGRRPRRHEVDAEAVRLLYLEELELRGEQSPLTYAKLPGEEPGSSLSDRYPVSERTRNFVSIGPEDDLVVVIQTDAQREVSPLVAARTCNVMLRVPRSLLARRALAPRRHFASTASLSARTRRTTSRDTDTSHARCCASRPPGGAFALPGWSPTRTTRRSVRTGSSCL